LRASLSYIRTAASNPVQNQKKFLFGRTVTEQNIPFPLPCFVSIQAGDPSTRNRSRFILKTSVLNPFLILFSVVLLHGCADLTPAERITPVRIGSISLTPPLLDFSQQTSSSDTSVTITLELLLKEPADRALMLAVSRNQTIFVSRPLPPFEDNRYRTTLPLNLNTLQSDSYLFSVYDPLTTESDDARAELRVTGITLSPPVLLSVSNPDTVKIPDSGTQQMRFEARAAHPQGLSFLSRVDLFLIDQEGIRLGDLFELTAVPDQTEPDSRLYTTVLEINENNQPDRVDVFYFATGVDGQRSDTLRTVLNIVP